MRQIRLLQPQVVAELDRAVEELTRLRGQLTGVSADEDEEDRHVEDNPDNRLLLEAILDGHFEIKQYEERTSALRGMKDAPPDLVLMDISLPGMDGEEVLGRLREDPTLRNLPVIALTAHAMRGDRELFLSAGFDDYVTKPIVDETVLFKSIERGLAAVSA